VNLGKETTLTCDPRLEPTCLNVPHNFKVVIQGRLFNIWDPILQDTKFELVVIGSGAGASYIYDGLTSSSFMLLCDGKPFCLIDLGLGVGRKVIESFSEFMDLDESTIKSLDL